jgi:hypothetical protein
MMMHEGGVRRSAHPLGAQASAVLAGYLPEMRVRGHQSIPSPTSKPNPTPTPTAMPVDPSCLDSQSEPT